MISSSLQEKIFVVVIEEAHLAEEWGKEFRKDFGKLSQLTSLFPSTPLLVLIATATKHSLDALIINLNLEKPCTIINDLNRENIIYSKESYNYILLSLAHDLKHTLVLYLSSLEMVWLCLQAVFGFTIHRKLKKESMKYLRSCRHRVKPKFLGLFLQLLESEWR